jgi:hypothetical protein
METSLQVIERKLAALQKENGKEIQRALKIESCSQYFSFAKMQTQNFKVTKVTFKNYLYP